MRDAGYKVAITGEGSDEILGGYAPFRCDMLLYNQEGQDRPWSRVFSKTWKGSIPCLADYCCRTVNQGRSTV